MKFGQAVALQAAHTLGSIVSALPMAADQEHPIEISSDEDDNDDCSICRQPRVAPGKRVTTLPCRHMFHTQCIMEWFRRQWSQQTIFLTCPICRALGAKVAIQMFNTENANSNALYQQALQEYNHWQAQQEQYRRQRRDLLQAQQDQQAQQAQQAAQHPQPRQRTRMLSMQELIAQRAVLPPHTRRRMDDSG